MTIRIRTGSRLHLGLLSVPGQSIESSRVFGGLGLMIDEPAVQVAATLADDWRSDGPSAERALDAAKRAAAGRTCPSLQISVEQCPDEHIGLGTGTQLAMAAAAAVRAVLGETPDVVEWAASVGRGLRSGLGVHGFAKGGFLVDGGKNTTTAVAPLVVRYDFPDDWRILLATPRHEFGLADRAEREAFALLEPDVTATDGLCRLALLGVLPALVERDLPAFGDAVHEFNRRAGLLFKTAQRGEYRSPAVAELVATIRGHGVRGVGQSSWGPTIFAIDADDRLDGVARRLRQRYPPHSLALCITAARNRGWERESDAHFLLTPSRSRTV